MTSAALTALVVLILDQLTKVWALEGLAPGRPVPVVDGFFSLTLVMNPGLAFGMLSSTPAGWRWVVALLSIGALDRARFGAVVDFLDFYWRGYHWPAFNAADSAITVGVGLLALRLLTAPPSTR